MLFFKPTSTRKLRELCEEPQSWLPCFFTSDQATGGNRSCSLSDRGPCTVQAGELSNRWVWSWKETHGLVSV